MACRDNRPRSKDNALKHEKTDKHQRSIRYHHDRQSGGFGAQHSSSDVAPITTVHGRSIAGIDLILREVADPTTDHNFGVDDESASMETGLDDADSHFQASFPEMGRAGIAAAVSKLLGEDELSEEEAIEQSDEEDGIEGVRGDDNEGMKTLNKLAAANINMAGGDRMKTGEWDTTQGQNEWFPWPDKLVSPSVDDVVHKL